MTPDTLPNAPTALVGPDGQPHCGRFLGLARHYNWQDLAPPYARSAWWRHFHHKRWHYVALAAGELFCGIAIVDLGWTNTAFAYAFDRRQRKVVAAFSQDGLPGLSARVGAHAADASSFDFFGKRIALAPQTDGAMRLTLACGQFQIDASFDAAQALLLAVGPVAGGSVHATQKSSGLALRGRVRSADAEYVLDGGVASFDYSNGLLARATDWRWASAHSLALGFNLQAGYFGANENALWIDGGLVSLGAAQFDYNNADPLAPWHVTTADGLLDLVFQPEGARREDKNLLVAASRYVQPIGTFTGSVRAHAGAPARRVEALVGVTEDHASRW